MDSKPFPINSDHVEHVVDTAAPAVDKDLHGWVGISQEARAATEGEHRLFLHEAIRKYPKAIFWSFIVSLAVIMEGYDTALIGSFFGYPSFQQKFGVPVAGVPGSYQVQPKWQTALGLASPLGNIVGVYINAVLTERIGHKKTLLGSLVCLTGFIFIVFFAPNVQVLFVGELLCGIPWGVFTTMAPAYASEVAPVVLRGVLQTWIVMCWGIGQLIAWGVLDGLVNNLSSWGWRIPFAVQWVWPVIIIPVVFFCPESPWWLVRRGRLQEAEYAVKRLSSSQLEDDARNTVALMVETTKVERAITEGAGYLECFKKENWWRTEISCMAWLTQAAAGFAIAQYAAYFFTVSGLAADQAYKLTLGEGGLALVFNIISIFVQRNVGRRKLYIGGCAAMSLVWFVVGFMAIATPTTGIAYASAAFFMIWFCLYQLTIGPVAFIVVGEASSTRLRSYSIALSRNAYNVWNIMSATVAPFILNPTAGNWKGKSAFLPAGLLVLCVIWGFFRLPEMKGRTYEELDLLFAKTNLSARKFASYNLDLDAEVVEKGVFVEEKVVD